MEAKVHYDIATTQKNPSSPSWFRRIAFLGAVAGAIVYAYAIRDDE
jgi:hypothetical protein